MGIRARAWAQHAMSAADIHELPARLSGALGEAWDWERKPNWVYGAKPQRDAAGRWIPLDHPVPVDQPEGSLDGPDTAIFLSDTLLEFTTPWRWRAFVSIPEVRDNARRRVIRVAQALGVSEILWVPDSELGPERVLFDDLGTVKEHLRREWGEPSDIHELSAVHVAAAEDGQVETWFEESVPSAGSVEPLHRPIVEVHSGRRVLDARFPSPWTGRPFVDDDEGILESGRLRSGRPSGPAFELAGPRERVAFDRKARFGVLTSGGLSPGMNDVIRGLVLALWHGYGIRSIVGIENGFDGLVHARKPRTRPLTPDDVRDIHHQGGTILGTSRGRQDLDLAARRVAELDLQGLFCIGGDGTLRGARHVDWALRARRVDWAPTEATHDCAVVGIPKTIDNDVPHCSRTFGFLTAVERAADAIACAHAEARSHRDGVAIVQLMGRESGFIAASATLACPDVNFCLVPEVPFTLGGESGLAVALARRLDERGHAVIVAAEGAGASLWSSADRTRDASGNLKSPPIGPHLVTELEGLLRDAGREPTIKLIDPSYMIRSGVAHSDDRILCLELAQAAAHAAMAGRTGIMIGLAGDEFGHVPFELACSGRKRLDPAGATWRAVLASTGQPPLAPE